MLNVVRHIIYTMAISTADYIGTHSKLTTCISWTFCCSYNLLQPIVVNSFFTVLTLHMRRFNPTRPIQISSKVMSCVGYGSLFCERILTFYPHRPNDTRLRDFRYTRFRFAALSSKSGYREQRIVSKFDSMGEYLGYLVVTKRLHFYASPTVRNHRQ